MDDETMIEIKTANDVLTASAGNNIFKLFAASESDFFLTSSVSKMHFVKEDKGKVSGFFFNKLTTAVNRKVFTALYQWFFGNLQFDNYTLDG